MSMFAASDRQATRWEEVANDAGESIPPFAVVPFSWDMGEGRLGRLATKDDESRQSPAMLGFNGPQAIGSRQKGMLTQHWPAIARLPPGIGEVHCGARLGPSAGEWCLRWGAAFIARGMAGRELVWVYPSQRAYTGPAWQGFAAGSQTVASGSSIAVASGQRVFAPSSISWAEELDRNFGGAVSAESDSDGTIWTVPRRGYWQLGFSAVVTSSTGLAEWTKLSFRPQVRDRSGNWHYVSAVAPGGTFYRTVTDGGYPAQTFSEQTSSVASLTCWIPLGSAFGLRIRNTSAVAIQASQVIVSLVHVGPLDPVVSVAWSGELWQ